MKMYKRITYESSAIVNTHNLFFFSIFMMLLLSIKWNLLDHILSWKWGNLVWFYVVEPCFLIAFGYKIYRKSKYTLQTHRMPNIKHKYIKIIQMKSDHRLHGNSKHESHPIQRHVANTPNTHSDIRIRFQTNHTNIHDTYAVLVFIFWMGKFFLYNWPHGQ